MAERRMFSNKITESDAFLDMPLSTQALYMHFCMNADDDGFVKNPKRICKMIGASDDDFKLLIAKSFVIPFERGVIVIKHWRMHNLLRKDRYKPTEYQEEKAMLFVKENGAYTLDEKQGESTLATKWQPNGNHLAPQVRLGKDRLGKDSRESKKPILEDITAYIKEKNMTVDPKIFFDYYEVNNWKDVKNWKQKLITWNSHEKKPSKQHNFEERNNNLDSDVMQDFERMMNENK